MGCVLASVIRSLSLLRNPFFFEHLGKERSDFRTKDEGETAGLVTRSAWAQHQRTVVASGVLFLTRAELLAEEGSL